MAYQEVGSLVRFDSTALARGCPHARLSFLRATRELLGPGPPRNLLASFEYATMTAA